MIRLLRLFRAAPLVVTLLTAMSYLSCQSRADDVRPTDLPNIRRVYVPADQPSKWPTGDRQPIELAEFERLLSIARQPVIRLPSAFIQRARYSATLSGNALVGGTLEFETGRTSQEVVLLPLKPLSLSVSRLAWDSRPALWGTTAAGEMGVVIDRGAGQLSGQWNAAGRAVGRHVEFDLAFAPATATQLTLRLPVGAVPQCSAGDLLPPQDAEQPGWTLWTIELGGRTSCRLTIVRSTPAVQLTPLILARTELTYVLRQEVVRFQAESSFEVLDSPVREVRLTLPQELQIVSVNYGDNANVFWRIETVPRGRQLVVTLPDALLGSSLPLRVQGVTRVNGLSPWLVPHLRLSDSVFTEGQLTLRVHPPLKVADLKIDGYRQNLFASTPAEGETFILRQLRAEPAAVVAFDDPRVEVASRSFSEIHVAAEDWTATARLELTARSGTTFTATVHTAADWEIIDVDDESPLSPTNLTGWQVQRLDNQVQSLTLQFRVAISSDNPQHVRISYRRNPATTNQQASMPVPYIVGEGHVESLVAIISDSDLHDEPETQGSFESITASQLTPDWATFAEWPRRADTTSQPLLLISRGAQPRGSIRLRSKPEPLAVTEVPAQRIIPDSPLAVTECELTAQLSLQSSGRDAYLAEYNIAPGQSRERLRWKLPHSAVLYSVEIDGRRVVPDPLHDEFTLSIPDSNSVQVVRLEYRTETQRWFGPLRKRLLVPDVAQAIPVIKLNLVLPEHAWLETEPTGFTSHSAHALQPRWTVLFGPLASRPGDAPFHPLRIADWRNLFVASHPPDIAQETSTVEQRGDIAEANFKTVWVWTGTQALPDGKVPEIRIVHWEQAEARGLAWTAFFASLLVGLCWRIVRLSGGTKFSVCWLSVTACGALLLPAVWSAIAGASFAGTFCAILCPQKRLRRTPRPGGKPSSVPTGSTRSFAPVATTLLVWLLASVVTSAIAQEKSNAASRSQSFDVLIPVAADGRPAGDVPRAYVPPELLTRLKQAAPARHPLPDYLISSADYHGSIGQGTTVRIKAEFQIVVISSESSVAVELPLSNVYPGGTEACLIDGQPHPLRLNATRTAFIVDLPGAATEPSPHRIELQLHLPSEAEGMSTQAQFGVPQVGDSRITLTTSATLPLLEVDGITTGKEPHLLIPDSREPYTARLGTVSEIRIRWSDKHLPPPAEPHLLASVSSIVDVSPAVLQIRHQVDYTVADGTVTSLKWRLPSEVPLVIRTVRSAELLHHTIETSADGTRHLVLDFSRPQTKEFAVTATFVLPVATPDAIKLPALPPVTVDPGTTSPSVRLNQLAFRYQPDSRLEVASLQGPLLRPKSIDEFLQSWEYVGTRPQSAWLLDSQQELSLKLSPLSPVFAVRSQSIARLVHDRLEITFSAEIDTQVAPAFRYPLEIDPRLKIASISILDDGAERLLRWSRSGNQVVLFLTGKTTGTQQLKLQAAMPLALPHEFDLPTVRFSEGTSLDSKLIVLRDEHVDVEFLSPTTVSSLTPSADIALQEKALFVAEFDAPESPITLRVSRNVSRAQVERNAGIIDVGQQVAAEKQTEPDGKNSSGLSQDQVTIATSTRKTRADGPAARILAALLLVALIVASGIWSRTRACIVWLQQHEPAAWFVLGVVWWLCLQPSIAGLGLMLVATLRALRTRRQSDATEFTLASDVPGPDAPG